MLRVLPRHGFPATTIGHITAEAGVSRAAFYQQFESKEACFLATHDLVGEWLCERVEQAVGEGGEWTARIRTGIAAALDLLAANPAVAHLIAVEAQQAGPLGRERQRACFARFAAALTADVPRRAEVPPEIEQLLFGGAIQMIARHVDTGRADQLPAVTADLVDRLLIPYLGQV